MSWIKKLKQWYRYCRNLKKISSKKPDKENYFKDQCRFYSQFITKGDLCFDVGANIGDKSEIFLELGGKVVAVEPQESCWRIIKRRFNNNNNQDLSIEPIVLAENVGRKILHVDKSPTISSISEEWIKAVKESGRFSDSHKWSYTIEVDSSTLDNLIAKYGKPSYCKIDVEGSELEVLKGLSQPIRYISMEFISERLDTIIECVEHLSRLGDVTFNYYFDESFTFELDKWLEPESFINHLKLMDKKLENYGEVYCCFNL
jgi:FkbM family methyltransferase